MEFWTNDKGIHKVMSGAFSGGERSPISDKGARVALHRTAARILLSAGSLLVWIAFHRAPQVAAMPGAVPGDRGYIESKLCSRCHSEVAATYYSSGMGRSLFRTSEKTRIEDYGKKNTYEHRASGLRYTMSERDGQFFQSREQAEFSGSITRDEIRIDYVVGSGNHARTYLSLTPQGDLLELPISWYSEGSGYWAMTSGFDRPNQGDFRQRIDSECLSCHSGSPLVLQRAGFSNGTETLFRTDLPEGIDCQRCHGPGRAHYIAATGGADPSTIRAAIVNPERLSRDRQMDVCMQCHLQTGVRNVPSELRRFDRDLFSYRPGEDLGRYKLYFLEPKNAEDDDSSANPDVVSAAYRLRKSRCYLASEMTCTTCHDPHREYRDQSSNTRYVGVCESCHRKVEHAVAVPRDQDCVSCHMPKVRVAPHDSPDEPIHITLTDHWIRAAAQTRQPTQVKAETAKKTSEALDLYYPSESLSPDSQLYLKVARVIHADNPANLKELRNAVAGPATKPAQFYLELSKGYLRSGKVADARVWTEAALKSSPGDVLVVKQLAALLLASGDWGQAVEVLKQAARMEPKDGTILDRLADASLRHGLLAEAEMSLRRALELDPADAQAFDLLGLVAVKNGRTAEATRNFREAIRHQPTLADPHIHLATLLARSGNYQEAVFHLRAANAINPASAEVHRGFGLALMATRAYDQAAEEFQEAVRLDPKDVQSHDDLGDLLAARKDLEGAAAQYQQALSLSPNLAEARYGLGTVYAAQGRMPEAEEEFRRCLQIDPGMLEAELQWGLALRSEHKMGAAEPHLQRAARSGDPQIANAAKRALEGLHP